MNEQTLELADQCYSPYEEHHIDLAKFAELIVRECISIVDKYGDSDEGNHIAYQIEKHFGVE